jgi:glyoxylase-like metal-dependent hydrolase (beta-lactamase superfamily II)
LIVKQLAVGPVETNCYILADETAHIGVVIDPGGDADRILEVVRDLRLAVPLVLNTHAHFDHTLANGEVVKATGAALCIHKADAPLLTLGGGAALFGMRASSPPADRYLDDGEVIKVGAMDLKVIHTPGHSPGGCSFLIAAENVLFSGDCLFAMGIGRTDLPGGDYDQLMDTLQNRIMTLPDETVVYPGHGPRTTIGRERVANPFLS